MVHFIPCFLFWWGWGLKNMDDLHSLNAVNQQIQLIDSYLTQIQYADLNEHFWVEWEGWCMCYTPTNYVNSL